MDRTLLERPEPRSARCERERGMVFLKDFMGEYVFGNYVWKYPAQLGDCSI
jgi:hypothetical protein